MRRLNRDPNAAWFVRFTLRPILEHLLVIVTFVVLALTGLPQKFPDTSWSRLFVGLAGGLDHLRTIHRVAGFTFVALALEHLFVEVYRLMFQSARATMVPTTRDFQDAVGYLRYCLGVSEKQPRMERYDYRQKFEYWGLLMGSSVMILSGLILFFPMQVAAIMPGVVVAAAKVAHSNEALLALLTVVTWHTYGAHLNPEIFPFDSSIFSGKISRARMLHEHPLEYEEMFGIPAPDPHSKPFATDAPRKEKAPGSDPAG